MFWQIEEIKIKKCSIFSIKSEDVIDIGNIYFGTTNVYYYIEIFRGDIFKGVISENLFQSFLNPKKGIFIKSNYKDEEYLYIDKDKKIFKINNNKIQNQIHNEYILKIMDKYE